MIFIAGGLAIWLAVASVIDAQKLILPDFITLPLIPAGIALTWLQPPDLSDRLLGIVFGYAVFAGISALYRCLRGRDGLGLGDAKLLAGAGAWVGWQGLPSVVLIASISGLAWALVSRARADRHLPFGPFLAFGFWLVWYLGPLGLEI